MKIIINNIKRLVFLICSCLLFDSCIIDNSCDPVLGCMDADATNYNPQAGYSNNSCEYISDIVFYLDANAAVYLGQQNVNQLSFYVNGENIGTEFYPFTFSLEDPSCTDPNFTTTSVIWDIQNTSTINWEAIDESGYIWYNSSSTIYPNDCLAIQLTTKMIQEYQESL